MFTESEGVLICGVFVVCQRKCVFLRGLRSLLWWLCVCNLVFDYLVDIQRFMGTGCSSWYKSEAV